jgi:hypothetical protein
MTSIRTLVIAALVAMGAAIPLGMSTAHADGWTNTGGLAWFK